MADIFISYRREDTQQIAASVYNFISEAFGSTHVFIDTANIGGGEKFMDVIQKNLSNAKVMIVLIGKNWLGDKGDGSNRIDEPEDPVHLEVRRGLELARAGNLAIIPVLIDNALMPTPSQFPADILDIQQINAEHIHSSLQYFEDDINRLLGVIHQKGVVRRVNGRVKKAPQRLRLFPIIGLVSSTLVNSVAMITLVSIIVISGVVVVQKNNYNPFSSTTSNPVVAHKPGTYHEYALPSPNTSVALLPDFITTGRDGNLWFVETPNNFQKSLFAVGHITPAGVARVLPPFTSSASSRQISYFAAGPIVSGSDGNLWVAENMRSGNSAADESLVIARVTPNGVVKEIPLEKISSSLGLIESPDGNVWVHGVLKPLTNSTNYNLQGVLARITPTGTVTTFPVPLGENDRTSDGNSLAVGANGNVWFDIRHTTPSYDESYSIGYITPDGTIRQFPIPPVSSKVVLNPTSMTTGPDGNIWVSLAYESAHEGDNTTLPAGGVIMRVAPDGSMQEFRTPVFNLFITSGHDGNLWFTFYNTNSSPVTDQTSLSGELVGNNSLYRITPTGTITQVPIPIQTTNGIIELTSGPDGNLWFTESNGKLGVYTP